MGDNDLLNLSAISLGGASSSYKAGGVVQFHHGGPMKTYQEILLEAADLLEKEEQFSWTQNGCYFSFDRQSGNCSMCAHGAIAYCGELLWVKGLVDNKILDVGNILTVNPNKNGTPTQVAHYKAISVGLTFDYNDSHKTSKQDVVAKLREAATI